MPRVSGSCGGAVTLIVQFFTQLHGIGLNLEFETVFELICQVLADLWHTKVKKNDCFKNKISFVLKQRQNPASFE